VSRHGASVVGVLLAATGALSYGVTVVLGRQLAAAGLGPATALGTRFTVAAVVLAVAVQLRRVSLRPEPGEAIRLLLLGAIGYTAESTPSGRPSAHHVTATNRMHSDLAAGALSDNARAAVAQHLFELLLANVSQNFG